MSKIENSDSYPIDKELVSMSALVAKSTKVLLKTTKSQDLVCLGSPPVPFTKECGEMASSMDLEHSNIKTAKSLEDTGKIIQNKEMAK